MRLKIHRGANEIGGSCVELSTGSTRILIDLGKPLKGDAPKISEDLKSVDAVLISHAHIDHYGLIGQLPDEVPVYAGRLSLNLIRFSRLFSKKPEFANTFMQFEKWQEFRIGDFKVYPYLMDHSAPDAYAFLIEAEGKRVFYSGDFRGHGRKRKLYENLVKHPAKAVDWMLMEGTMLGRKNIECPDEDAVEEGMLRVLEADSGPCFLICSGQNIDRLVCAYRACLRAGRIFVLDIYTAWVLRLVSDTIGSKHIPDIGWDSIKVLSQGRFAAGHYQIVKANRWLFGRFSNELYSDENKISVDDIAADPGKYMIKTSFSRKLIDLLNPEHASIVYSMWEGYLEKEHNEKGYKDYQMLINNPRVNFAKIHTSGHAVLEDLQELAASIKPTQLVPIHTEHADQYHKCFSNVMIVENNKEVSL